MPREGLCLGRPVPVLPLSSQHLNGYFLPTLSFLSKFVIKLVEDEVVTLMVSVACKEASLRLCLLGRAGDLIAETRGQGRLLLPAVPLLLANADMDDSNNPVYYGELTVENNSWQLNEEELAFLESIKDKYSPYKNINVKGSKMSMSRSSRRSKESSGRIFGQGPVWNMSLITTQTQGPGVKLDHDCREYDQAKLELAEKEAADPGRAAQGLNLREQFLSAWLAERDLMVEEEVIMGESFLMAGEDEGMIIPPEDTPRVERRMTNVDWHPILSFGESALQKELARHLLPLDKQRLYSKRLKQLYPEISSESVQFEQEEEEEAEVVQTSLKSSSLVSDPSKMITYILCAQDVFTNLLSKKIDQIKAQGDNFIEEIYQLRDMYITDRLEKEEVAKANQKSSRPTRSKSRK